MGLRYVGAPVATDPDLAYRDYLTLIKDADLSTEEIDTVINNGLANYATVTYVDAQDALLSTHAYIDAQDNLRVKTASKDIPNGVAALDATGKILTSRINTATTQNYPRGPWTPATVNAGVNFTTEATLFTVPVTDPGYPYRLLVFGQVDAHSSSATEYPVINVRVGTATGDLVASGGGSVDGGESLLNYTDSMASNSTNSGGMGGNWSMRRLSGTRGGYIKVARGPFQPITAIWGDDGGNIGDVQYRRIDTDGRALTAGDFQRVSIDKSADNGETTPVGGEQQYIRTYARMNDTGTDWVAAEIGEDTIRFVYSIGDVVTQLGPSIPGSQSGFFAGWYFYCGDPSPLALNRRRLILKDKETGTLIHQVDDSAMVTRMGPNWRGWGFGAKAPANLSGGQTTPPPLDAMGIADLTPQFTPVALVPAPGLGALPARTGATTLYVRGVRSGAAATMTADALSRIHVMAVPA